MGDEGVEIEARREQTSLNYIGFSWQEGLYDDAMKELREYVAHCTETLRAEVELLHQANKEHLVIAEKLNSECQRNEYLAEQVARLEKERDLRKRTLLAFLRQVAYIHGSDFREIAAILEDPIEIAAAEARIRELEGGKS